MENGHDNEGECWSVFFSLFLFFYNPFSMRVEGHTHNTQTHTAPPHTGLQTHTHVADIHTAPHT